jgi:hypothetical protein
MIKTRMFKQLLCFSFILISLYLSALTTSDNQTDQVLNQNTPLIDTENFCLSVDSAIGLKLFALKAIDSSVKATAFDTASCQLVPTNTCMISPLTIKIGSQTFTAASQNIAVNENESSNINVAYQSNTCSTGTVCLSISPALGLKLYALKAILIGNSSVKVTAFDTASCQLVKTGTYTISPPTIIIGTQTFTAPSQIITVNKNETSNINVVYQSDTGPTGTVCLSISSVEGLKLYALKALSIGGVCFKTEAFEAPVCQSVPIGRYVISPATISVEGQTFTAPSQTIIVKEAEFTQVDIVYQSTTPPPGKVCLSIDSVPGLKLYALKAISVGNNTSIKVAAFFEAVCASVTAGTYVIVPPAITIESQTFTAPPQIITVSEAKTTTVEIIYEANVIQPEEFFNVALQMGTAQEIGPEVYQNTLNFFIENAGETAINIPWNISFTNSTYTNVAAVSNVIMESFQQGTISAYAINSSELLEPNEANLINVQFVITSNFTDFTPQSVTINGNPVTFTLTP